MRGLLSGLLSAAVLTLVVATPVSAYTYNVYPGAYATQQPNHYACAAASSVTWVNVITGETNYSASRVQSFYDEGITLNKYTSGNPLYGIDPRGWARLMYNRTPSGYTFNDYIYTSQSAANSEIVYGIRVTGEPVGVLVARGEHALLAVGFQSSRDPQSGLPWSLEGFRVVDP